MERVIEVKIKAGLLSFQEEEGGLSLVCTESVTNHWNEAEFQSLFQQGQALFSTLGE